MSAKKRRIKRKLALLRKMDKNYMRFYLSFKDGVGSAVNPNKDIPKSLRVWFGSIIPLGDALQARGELRPGNRWTGIPMARRF